MGKTFTERVTIISCTSIFGIVFSTGNLVCLDREFRSKFLTNASKRVSHPDFNKIGNYFMTTLLEPSSFKGANPSWGGGGGLELLPTKF